MSDEIAVKLTRAEAHDLLAADGRSETRARDKVEAALSDGVIEPTPIPMLLTCPSCSARHVDKGEFATKPHHTHACQQCGMVWRPAIVPTVGVQFLPGYNDTEAT